MKLPECYLGYDGLLVENKQKYSIQNTFSQMNHKYETVSVIHTLLRSEKFPISKMHSY